MKTELKDFEAALRGLCDFYQTPSKKGALETIDLALIEEFFPVFVSNVIKSVCEFRKCSPKQLYIIAKAYAESGKFYVGIDNLIYYK